MKLINEKGKLLGIINVIDFLVILMVICIGAGIFLKSQGFDTISNTTKETKEIEILVKISNKDLAFYEGLEKGQKLVEKNKYTNGEIKSIEIKDSLAQVKTEDGQLVLTNHPYNKDAFVKITLTVDVKGPILSFGEQEIRVGSYFWVTTDKARLLGYIYKID